MSAIAQATPETEALSRRVYTQVITQINTELFLDHGQSFEIGERAIPCADFGPPPDAPDFQREVRPRIDEPAGAGKNRGGKGRQPEWNDRWTWDDQWDTQFFDHRGPKGHNGVGKGRGCGASKRKGKAPWQGERGRTDHREQRDHDWDDRTRSRRGYRPTEREQ